MKYFIIAGEASGDLHASRLMQQLKIQDPQAEFTFLGGDLMQAVGGTMIQHYKNMAFMGVVNVLLNLKKIKNNIELCKTKLLESKPDMVILIDYPGFNLRIAQWLKTSLPQTTIHYYIAPKLWAWKSYRIKAIKKYIDHMYTIFPFETEYFSNKGYEVTYVGNPCVDAVREFFENNSLKAEFLNKYKLSNKPIIALLAGSRRQEIKGCLKKMSAMAEQFPEYQFIIAGAPGIETDFYHSVAKSSLPIISGDTYNLLNNAHAAVVNSGTATLETALIGTPQVIVYHVFGGIIASILKNILLHIPYVSLVNLIAEKKVAQELIAHEFNTKNLKQKLFLIANNDVSRSKILSEYEIIKSKLGNNLTAQKCAEEILKNHTNKQ